MDDRAFDRIRRLSRQELETLAHRAVLRIRQDGSEMERTRLFLAGLIGFLIGALVAAAGFIAGSTLA